MKPACYLPTAQDRNGNPSHPSKPEAWSSSAQSLNAKAQHSAKPVTPDSQTLASSGKTLASPIQPMTYKPSAWACERNPMAYQLEFYPPIQDAMDKMAISPLRAWELELALNDPAEYSREDWTVIQWINLVNMPAKHLQAQ